MYSPHGSPLLISSQSITDLAYSSVTLAGPSETIPTSSENGSFSISPRLADASAGLFILERRSITLRSVQVPFSSFSFDRALQRHMRAVATLKLLISLGLVVFFFCASFLRKSMWAGVSLKTLKESSSFLQSKTGGPPEEGRFSGLKNSGWWKSAWGGERAARRPRSRQGRTASCRPSGKHWDARFSLKAFALRPSNRMWFTDMPIAKPPHSNDSKSPSSGKVKADEAATKPAPVALLDSMTRRPVSEFSLSLPATKS
ncbi:nucleotidylyl transferase superfamily protein [Striga asiatica]|uniref:Nucleotidylyl transferase superfamily protein n=1 Tax=Striga asiatica TaxID=4170 RepID=A0A5A7R837_STRAF|nr:nucleotidylyl transferase superfamily protein [Striga asiatica]